MGFGSGREAVNRTQSSNDGLVLRSRATGNFEGENDSSF